MEVWKTKGLEDGTSAKTRQNAVFVPELRILKDLIAKPANKQKRQQDAGATAAHRDYAQKVLYLNG